MSSRTVAASVQARERPDALGWLRRNGLLLGSALLWLVFMLNFNAFGPADGDAAVQYRFVQKLFGDAPHAIGYFFGLGLVEAPFYAFGKLLGAAGVDTIYGTTPQAACVGVGLGLLTLAVWPLLVPVLRGLRLRGIGFVLLAGVFGTPFFYYSSIDVGKNHPIDALLLTAVVYLVFRYLRSDDPERWLTFAIGAIFGLSYAVRYFNGAEAVALVAVLLLWRRWRHAAEVAVTSAVVFGALYAIPVAFGVSVFGTGSVTPESALVFAPLNPVRMLFTDHRGLFVWSPVTVLAAVGLVVLFRRRPEQRRFLTAVTAMSLGVIGSYAFMPWWDGAWSFGQRFYIPLFPVVVIGLAGLLEVAPRLTVAAATVTVAWSLYLGFTFFVIGGPQYLADTPGGVEDLAVRPAETHNSVGSYLWGVWYKSKLLHWNPQPSSSGVEGRSGASAGPILIRRGSR